MRVKKEIKYESYNCPLLGGTAKIQLTYLIHESSRTTGVVDKRAKPEFECDRCRDCGVEIIGIKNGLNTLDFDWSKCTHPLSPNK